MRILKESSYQNLVVEKFRERVWEEAKKLSPWTLPPYPFKSLLEKTSPASLGIFFSKAEWGEPSELHVQINELLSTSPNIEILGPSINGAIMAFYPVKGGVVEQGPRNIFQLQAPPEVEPEKPKTLQESMEQLLTSARTARTIESFPELILMPALACDQWGRRIGRGGGFYDRYIATRPVTGKPFAKCAVIHSSFMFEELPSTYFHAGDKSVDFILTEKELYEISTDRREALL